MRPSHGVWTITFDGEADDTYERLLNELSGLIVEVEPVQGQPFDAALIDAHTYRPSDENGLPIGAPRKVDRVAAIHVY